MSAELSSRICLKSADAICWKTIAATPRDFIPSEVSSVTCAVAMANSRSAFAVDSFLRPPRIESRNPNALGRDRRLQLGLHPLERLDALLHRRVRQEQRVHRRLHARGDDEERVHPLGLTQVLVGHALHR